MKTPMHKNWNNNTPFVTGANRTLRTSIEIACLVVVAVSEVIIVIIFNSNSIVIIIIITQTKQKAVFVQEKIALAVTTDWLCLLLER